MGVRVGKISRSPNLKIAEAGDHRKYIDGIQVVLGEIESISEVKKIWLGRIDTAPTRYGEDEGLYITGYATGRNGGPIIGLMGYYRNREGHGQPVTITTGQPDKLRRILEGPEFKKLVKVRWEEQS